MAFYLASTWKTMGGCQEFSTNTITKVMYVSIQNYMSIILMYCNDVYDNNNFRSTA